MFLLWLRQLPWYGARTPASVPPPAEGRSSPTNTPVFPPSSFLLLNFAWFNISFSTGVLMHFCVWRCIPDVSVERDVVHIHLLLHHLLLYGFISNWLKLIFKCWSKLIFKFPRNIILKFILNLLLIFYLTCIIYIKIFRTGILNWEFTSQTIIYSFIFLASNWNLYFLLLWT